MTPKTLSEFRGVLEMQQADLERLLGKREIIVTGPSADMIDQIQHASERDMAISGLERESARLQAVRGALRRIDLGTFGICFDCEEQISMKRLSAVPWAATCLLCQQTADRGGISPQRATGPSLVEAP